MQTNGVLDGPISSSSGMFDWEKSIGGSPLYSDELANGDSADDKDIHEDSDMNDDVVDYNGGTSRGYGSHEPMTDFVANNPIMSGSHNNGPRETETKTVNGMSRATSSFYSQYALQIEE